MKEGRKEERKKGRKEERKKGSKEERKEGRKYKMRVAEEGELYMQHYFSHWVLMRLHISSRKVSIKEQGEFSQWAGPQALPRKNASTTFLSPKYEEREIQDTSRYGSVWTTIRCSPWSLVSQPLGVVHLSVEGV